MQDEIKKMAMSKSTNSSKEKRMIQFFHYPEKKEMNKMKHQHRASMRSQSKRMKKRKH